MKRIEVVAAIIKHEGKYLATQRGYGDWKGWIATPSAPHSSGKINLPSSQPTLSYRVGPWRKD